MYRRLYIYIGLIVILFSAGEIQAQVNSIKRYEIDLKRKEIPAGEYNNNEMMLRAKEFIRKDPSYYVGYLLEGLYRYDRSGDVAGYTQAIKPLRRAMELFENDFSIALRDVYSSEEAYAEYHTRIVDYIYVIDKLMDCYSNIERPDSVIWVLNRYKSWNFSHDELGADNYIAWTYHRNRFYTSEKYDFLYNSVDENEAAALHFLKQNLERIDKNTAKNEDIVGPMAILGSKLSVYHYLAIVYSYQHKPDSAAMYFNFMRPYGAIFPYNNFAIFCFVNGNFDNSYNFFRLSQYYQPDRYRLKESVYYMSILEVMRGNPQESVSDLSLFIKESGVRPGWGWYNIGLARSLMYNGQLDSSMICINKAAKFHDVHIGTTWGQSLYTFSHTILKLIVLQKKEAALRFEDKYYWLSPSKLKKMAQLKLEQYIMQMLIFNQLSANPERSDVYYRLFASEATISFDEIFYTIKDYGRKFFISEFEKQAKTDEREPIRKYFRLFAGKLYLEKGDSKNALKILEDIYDKDVSEGKDFEKLYQARLYEALTLANEAAGNSFEKHRMRFYKTYPQLVPFSDITMKFNLKAETGDIESAEQILTELKAFNIDFTNESEKNIPTVKLLFKTIGDKTELKYSVVTDWGVEIVEPASIIYSDTKDIAKKLAYALFNLKF